MRCSHRGFLLPLLDEDPDELDDDEGGEEGGAEKLRDGAE